MSSEDLNLPASLERLEINPERLECSKTDENPFSYGVSCPLSEAPECSLETLSLNAVCPKGSCLCNRKKDGGGRNNPNASNSKFKYNKIIVRHRRPLIRRSKLNREVLRAPILRLGGNETVSEGNSIGKSSSSFKAILEGKNTVISGGNTAEPVALCCPTSGVGASTIATTIQRSPSFTTYLTSAATSSHCCALQARSVINNNNNTTTTNSNTTSSSASSSNSPSTDDTNIDELASYFDLFVHIPKKMSVMAEMMYI